MTQERADMRINPESDSRRSDSRRMVQLDVLRGIAILMVLCNHLVMTPGKAGILQVPAELLHSVGRRGVELFFVLSGFLIGGLLMHEIRLRGGLDVKRFLIRRAFKIWPVYYVYLAFQLVLLVRHQGVKQALWTIGPNVMHLQNSPSLHRIGFVTHTWSLAVEEHFYLALPFLLLFLARPRAKRLHWIPMIAIGVDLLCLCLRLNYHGQPYKLWVETFPTHLRMDSLFTGVLLAYWYHFRPRMFASMARYRRPLLWVGLLLIAPTAVFPEERAEFVWTFGYTLINAAYACLLIAFVTSSPGEGGLGRWLASKSARALAFIGTFSYSIYIWHPDLVTHPLRRMCDAGWLGWLPAPIRWTSMMLLYFAAAVTVGIVLSRLIEKPSLALRNRLFPERADALGREKQEVGRQERRSAVVKAMVGTAVKR